MIATAKNKPIIRIFMDTSPGSQNESGIILKGSDSGKVFWQATCDFRWVCGWKRGIDAADWRQVIKAVETAVPAAANTEDMSARASGRKRSSTRASNCVPLACNKLPATCGARSAARVL